jgi:signal transduction histidine kinase
MRRRSSRFVLCLAPATLALGIILLAAVELWRSHDDARRNGEEAAGNLVHILAEQTERTFQAVDFTLLGIRDALTIAPDTPENDSRFRATLKERLKALPYVRALFVIGPGGFITHDTDYPTTPRVSLADRPYFKAHQSDPDLGLHLAHPLRSRSVTVWFVSFSRRINRPDGSFGGIVVAAVEPRYFEHFYGGLSVGENSIISLFLSDGTLLARSPEPEQAIGESFADSELFLARLPASPEGVYWSTSPIDNIERVLGYQTLDASPVIVQAGLSARSVFQPWRAHARVVLIGAVVLLGLIGFLITLLQKYHERELHEQARLIQAQRLEALGRIAGGIAHDFGNTIRIIQSTFALLRPSLSHDSDAMSLLDDANRALKGARDMVGRLLAFARRQELRPESTRIDELISGFASILRQAAGPLVQIDLKLSGAAGTSFIDPVQLEAALLNLVLNARDAMPRGGTITIETESVAETRASATRDGYGEGNAAWVQITVSDDGVGMSRKILDQAFDPFFTTKEPGQGNGLGLSQVLGFVQQSAGEIQRESQEGNGTKVRLRFPVQTGGEHGLATSLAARAVSPEHCGRGVETGVTGAEQR